MYRICEGVLNGELSEDDFLDLHRRYQRIMVTLVAIEQLTGAVRPPPVAIQTDAIGGRPARLNDLQDELEEAREKVATLEGEVETAGSENEFQRTDDDGNSVDVACSEATEEELQDEESCSELVKAKANLESAKANVKTLEKEVETVRSEIVNRASGSVKLVDNRSSNFNLDQQSVKKISETIKSMVASMFRLDPDSAISEYRKMKCSNVRDLYSQASTSDIFDNATWPDDKIAETREVLGLENFRLTNQEVRRATFEVLKAENEMCKALIDLVTNE
jgi:hypothetical protein